MIEREWLKEELKKPGRSQAGLGRHMGLHATNVNRLVNGTREIKQRDVTSIQQYLDATATGDERPPAMITGMVTLDIKATVSVALATKILAMLNGAER